MSRAQRYGYPIALVMADIDRFKEINDRFGHQAGDDVLKEVARTLKARIRKEDTLIRYGGDEFLIVLPQADAANIERFIHRIKESIASCKGSQKMIDFTIGLSIGMAVWTPSEKKSIEAVLHAADIEMYQSKKAKHPSR
jgi:diguanylate cyclase (GGDEF)-like protein